MARISRHTGVQRQGGQWVNIIGQVAIQDEGAAGGAGRSQTLPEQGRKDEPKKRSFFTLKKK